MIPIFRDLLANFDYEFDMGVGFSTKFSENYFDNSAMCKKRTEYPEQP